MLRRVTIGEGASGSLRAGVLRWRRLLLPSSLVWLLIVAVFAGVSTVGLMVLVLLVLAFALVVLVHRSLRRSRGGSGAVEERPLLRTPGQVAIAVAVVVVFGALAGAQASIMLAVVAPSLAGDGSVLVRLCVGVFAFVGCMAVGSRCGQWWAFLGAIGLVPLLGLSVLVSSGRADSGARLAVVSVVSVAFAVATGSLNQELTSARRSSERTQRTARAEDAQPEYQTGRTAASRGH